MEEIKVTKTVEEVKGYKAIDGTVFFGSEAKKECEKYENSAICVATKIAKKHMVAETDTMTLFESGDEDDVAEIFYIDSIETLSIINNYINLASYNKVVIDESFIGKNIILCWGYEHDYCWVREIETYIANLRKRYNNLLDK